MENSKTGYEALMAEAVEARKRAYCPYSRFAVGAALLTEEGRIYTGCNIENAAYSPGCCAERTAFFSAVNSGERHFSAIAIAGGPEGENAAESCPPCGVCRQVMREFCDPETFEIITRTVAGQLQSHTLGQLLPESFGPQTIRR